MKNPNMRPLSTKSLTKNSKKSQHKWLLVVALVVLFIGYLIWKNALSDTSFLSNSVPITEQVEVTMPASMPLDSTVDNTVNNSDVVLERNDNLSVPSTDQLPKPDAILNAPIPETSSLVKEESDRLNDERIRSAEQEKLLAEQMAMNKQLTEMKAEQIALVEQQIAQLEANNTVQTDVK